MDEQPELEETELMLALLCSMIDNPSVSHEVLLGALADAGGNVNEAAEALNAGPQPSSSKPRSKRKRDHGLDKWVTNKKRTRDTTPAGQLDGKASSPARVQESPTPGFAADAPICIESDSESGEDAANVDLLVNSASAYAKSPDKDRLRAAIVPLMDVLKQAPNSLKKSPRLLPRTLGTCALVARHTPCTLHASILPPELACRVFYAMLREAASWPRNQWWLFDRLVESPHRTCFYSRRLPEEDEEATSYWYNGSRAPNPAAFLPEMEEACEIIEKTVNEEILKRDKLFPSEWQTTPEHPWRANVAVVNCYTGSKDSVGYHSDQYGTFIRRMDLPHDTPRLTHLGPCPTIASLSLGTTRTFRIREVVPQSEKEERSAQTFNIPATHNSLIIMHASCQERFKHTIPPQPTIDIFKPAFPPPIRVESGDDSSEMMPPETSRINITFRFFRPDFVAKTVPKCKCGIPTVLRPDMKRRESNGTTSSEWGQMARMRYFWTCYSAPPKGCSFFQVLDMEKEGRGLQVTPVASSPS